MSSCSYIIYLYMVYWHCFICSNNNSKNSFKCYFHHFKLVENFKLNQVDSSEHLVLHTILYTITPIVQMFYKLSSITIAYHGLGLKPPHLTLLVTISDNHISLFTISYKNNYSSNLSGGFDVLNILVHTSRLFSLQYNERCLLWNHICILVYHIIIYHYEMC